MKLRITRNPLAYDPDPRKRINFALFRAIGIIARERCWTSSLKLLVSAIDTLAALDSSDGRTSYCRFRAWLNDYADLAAVGISAEELYQHRCSLLHLTGLDSDAVKKGTVLRLIPYKRPASPSLVPPTPNSKFYEINELMSAIKTAAQNYCDVLERDPKARRRFDKNAGKLLSDFFGVQVTREDA